MNGDCKMMDQIELHFGLPELRPFVPFHYMNLHVHVILILLCIPFILVVRECVKLKRNNISVIVDNTVDV